MDAGIEVSTAIFNDGETEIGVSSLEQGGKDDAAGSDSKRTSVSMSLARRIMLRSVPVKALMRCLVITELPLFRRDDRWNRPERFLK